MSVVAMKRVMAVSARDRAEALLSALQDRGVVHLVPLSGMTDLPAEPGLRAAAAKRVKTFLEAKRDPDADVESDAVAALSSLPDDQLLERAQKLLARRTETESAVAQLTKEYQGALPFGSVCQADFDELVAHGLTVRVYSLAKVGKKKPEVPAGVVSFELPWNDNRALVTASFDPAFEMPLERIDPPQRPAPVVATLLEDAKKVLAELDGHVQVFATRLDGIRREVGRLLDIQHLQEAKAEGGHDPDIFAVSGWCPSSSTGDVVKAATEVGGACFFEDPEAAEEPPIQLHNSRLISWFEPLLEAFQLPKYREPDPTFLFAPFMALFFGFCLGDMAYGVLLFLGATWLHRKLGATADVWHKSFRLMQLLGGMTVLVGFLTGSVFGYPLYEIGAFQQLGLTSDKLLFFLSKDPQNFFYAALIFGAVQLGLGIVVRLVMHLKKRQFQRALATTGWLLLLPAVPLWVAMDLKQPFFVALGLIVLFKSPGNLLHRFGGGLWGLYEWVLGLFGDIMSYLRIFGLGLSSGIIAQVINTIAWMMFEGGSVGGYIGGVLILFIGHTFNFAMAVLGSTVHSARLQFLEYFGKFFEGGGQPFRPFARTK
jgi:V/A-type H+-transporting ATPase subunit I